MTKSLKKMTKILKSTPTISMKKTSIFVVPSSTRRRKTSSQPMEMNSPTSEIPTIAAKRTPFQLPPLMQTI
jgi:hypothetical protein